MSTAAALPPAADRRGTMGRPKSEAGERTVPLPPMVVAALREHRLACRNSELDLAFPNSKGHVDHRNSIVYGGFHPAQVAAGVVDQHGGAKYKGLHSLRHFYASWCINRASMAGSSCRSSWCRPGSATRAFR